MTRKDFIVIAEIIKNLDADDACHGENARRRIAHAFANGLHSSNPRFNGELFVQAATGQVPLNARKARNPTLEERSRAWAKENYPVR